MRLPDQRKILREDIKTTESWVSSLIDPINSFFDIIYIGLNRNLTRTENLRCIVKTVDITTGSTYPVMEAIKFPNTMKVKATGCLIVQAIDRDTYTPTVTENPAWIENNGVIIISQILGLTASKNYTLTFEVY